MFGYSFPFRYYWSKCKVIASGYVFSNTDSTRTRLKWHIYASSVFTLPLDWFRLLVRIAMYGKILIAIVSFTWFWEYSETTLENLVLDWRSKEAQVPHNDRKTDDELHRKQEGRRRSFLGSPVSFFLLLDRSVPTSPTCGTATDFSTKNPLEYKTYLRKCLHSKWPSFFPRWTSIDAMCTTISRQYVIRNGSYAPAVEACL